MRQGNAYRASCDTLIGLLRDGGARREVAKADDNEPPYDVTGFSFLARLYSLGYPRLRGANVAAASTVPRVVITCTFFYTSFSSIR